MRNFFLACLLLLACTRPSGEPASSSSGPASMGALLARGSWIDLTHSFSDSTLYWPNNKIGFHLDTLFNGPTAGGYFYSSYQFCMPEHGGTHLDAPIHFVADRWTSEQIPPDRFHGEAVVIDVSEKARPDRDYRINAADLQEWERRHGRIPANAVVLLRTGYGEYYPDPQRYFGTSQRGAEAVSLLHFPGLDPDAASWLVQHRAIKAIGLDTPSIDYGQSQDFKSHRILLDKHILVFENVANLHQLPPTGSYVFAFPMKIKGGSGGPLRIVAWK
jgi:kynurenine formamidase